MCVCVCVCIFVLGVNVLHFDIFYKVCSINRVGQFVRLEPVKRCARSRRESSHEIVHPTTTGSTLPCVCCTMRGLFHCNVVQGSMVVFSFNMFCIQQ